MRRRLVSVLLPAAALVGLLAAPAAAHVTANPNAVPADGYAAVSLRVPHGCGDAATTELAVQMPAGVQSATPEQVPGWTVRTVVGELDEPYDAHGETVTEGVREVVWTAEAGAELPSDQYREFGLSLRVGGEDGETLYFPTVQTCTEGETAWVEIPDTVEQWGELDRPAPYVTLTGGAGHGDDAAEASDLSDADLAAAETGTTASLTWVAFALGLVGAVAGLGALAVARRR
ncbi:YcnI family protein [Egicoccus sp. AB-alg2]|uniref:YcnI family protein n=1 Tax=Egicoccus sp. AB-alg2 TaxID=3242693 RepID=UPI00359D02D8